MPQTGATGTGGVTTNTYMVPFARLPVSLLFALALSTLAGKASAWVDAAVMSDIVTVDVETSGQATVSHELTMRLRGGPLKGTEISGVDADATPLEGATVSKVGDGDNASKPLAMARGDDDTLKVELTDELGLRSGTFLFKFRYRTDLRSRARIEQRGSWAELSWIGPRYAAGLDVARVTFRLPYAPMAPRLPEIDANLEESGEGASAFLSNLRRGGTVDELELIRPHVAKGEPVLWKAWVAPEAFEWLKVGGQRDATQVDSRSFPRRSPWAKALPLILATLFAVMIVALVWFKSRAVAELERREGIEFSSLFRVGAKWRAAFAGCAAGGALWLSVRFEWPTVAAGLLGTAMLLSTYRRPSSRRVLRGPGRWLILSEEDAWREDKPKLTGRALDGSTWIGKLIALSYAVVLLAVVRAFLAREPYYAWLILVGSAVVLPSLLTGCYSTTPSARDRACRRLLKDVARRLRRDKRTKVSILGRFADGHASAEQLRIRVGSASSLPGFISVELATSCDETTLEPELSLLVRVRDGSDALAQWASELEFTRGRNEQERVAVIRCPVTTTRRRLLRWVSELTTASERDSEGVAQKGGLPTSLDRSEAKGSSTEKPGRSGSPSQATRAA